MVILFVNMVLFDGRQWTLPVSVLSWVNRMQIISTKLFIVDYSMV